ncbi:hypothetical protein KY338_00355 [Candidatus Woesearchaeota archaeon]|nr:hypothetical protein [Candidatus Woesearchaeota archaeon]MBW3005226.1 hypothetical protein [Candidatus Woesearchaeota archaeon]
MDEKKHLSLVILGIVAVIAIVGLILLFKGAMSGAYSISSTAYGLDKSYSGAKTDRWQEVYGSWVTGVPETYEQPVYYAGYWDTGSAVMQVKPTVTRSTSVFTSPCYPNRQASRVEQIDYWVGDTACEIIPW